MIRWELSVEGMCCAEPTTDVASDWISSKTIYKLEEISNDFFNSEAANGFTEIVEDLLASSTLDDVYNQFHSQLFAEMDNELPHFKSNNSWQFQSNNRKPKPYWSNELRELWRKSGESLRRWRKCVSPEKQTLKEKWLQDRKVFDKELQKAKRNYWFILQQELLTLQSNNPKDFWQYIKHIGNEKSSVPREVLMEDGSVCKDKNKVLDRWADAFQKLLNEGNANVDNSDLLLNDDDNDNLCDQITLDEVKNAVSSMQNGKARGIDEIPMEVLRNRNVTKFMCAFFNKCFKDRSVPKGNNKSYPKRQI